MNQASLTTRSESGTSLLGHAIGSIALSGDVFLLSGELGTGKTCLIRGLARGLGIEQSAFSPSFVLVREYKGRLTLYHMDFYRLDADAEIVDLGIDDYLNGDGVCAIEWADRAAWLAPRENLKVELAYSEDAPDSRTVRLSATGYRHERLLNELRKVTLEDIQWN